MSEAKPPSSALAVLQKVPLFRELSPSQVKQVFALCQHETHDAGWELCRAGTESDQLYVLLSGTVEVSSESGVLLARETAVTTIGETGVLTGEHRSAHVVASTPVSVLSLSRRAFLRVVQIDPALAVRLYRNVMFILRSKLMAANARIDEVVSAAGGGEDDTNST
ncbi:cyclic nucleotide-binding domain-containing protein [Candidatus Latescibacterota bacterium]